MSVSFIAADTWVGGFYELAIELGFRSDDRLLKAMSALWFDSALDGPFQRRDLEPLCQERLSISTGDLEAGHLYGLARLPNGASVPCGSVVIREEDGPDWLDLYLPMGSLAGVYPVGGFPFEPDPAASRLWRREVDGWLTTIGRRLYQQVEYRLGLVGFEVSGEIYADEIVKSGIPESRQLGLLWPVGGQLSYHPGLE